MHHTALVVVLHNNCKRPTKQLRERQISDCGGLRHTTTSADKAAAAISKLPWVERVVATHVSETHAGTWRKGRKSV